MFYTCASTMMCLIAVWLKMTIHQVCVWSKQDFMNTIITTSMFIANLMTVIMVIKIIKMLIRLMTKAPFSFKMMWMMMMKMIIIKLSILIMVMVIMITKRPANASQIPFILLNLRFHSFSPRQNPPPHLCGQPAKKLHCCKFIFLSVFGFRLFTWHSLETSTLLAWVAKKLHCCQFVVPLHPPRLD